MKGWRKQWGWEQGRVHLRLQLLWGSACNIPTSSKSQGPQTHFLSQFARGTRTLKACLVRTFSVLLMPLPAESIDCWSYKWPEEVLLEFMDNISVSKLREVDLITWIEILLLVITPKCPKCYWECDRLIGQMRISSMLGIWFLCTMLLLMLMLTIEDDTDDSCGVMWWPVVI